jgi:hypothetical protein
MQDDCGTVLVQAKMMAEEVGASLLKDLLYYPAWAVHGNRDAVWPARQGWPSCRG